MRKLVAELSGDQAGSRVQNRAAAADGGEPVFLRFRAAQGWAGSQPIVGLVLLAAVTALLSPEEMTATFGGLTLYEDAQGYAYLGVWGARKVGRFLALLRTRGLAPRVSDAPPKGLRQRWQSVGTVPSDPVPPEIAATQVEVSALWWAMLDELDERPARLAQSLVYCNDPGKSSQSPEHS